MPIIKLNAIDSTNTYLRELSSENVLQDYTVVLTENQLKGRGQMGTQWVSEEGKNLTFSVFKDIKGFYLEHPFGISTVVALTLVDTLKHFSIPKVKIKWPNDILSDNKKVCGILIENVIKRNKMTASIIGVGLNVNQTQFNDLPSASSLRLLMGRAFNLDEVLHIFIDNLTHNFKQLEKGDYRGLINKYELHLFRKNKPSTFKDAEGNMFPGIIRSVSTTGNLQVLLEDDVIREFDMKEVVLLY